MPGVIDQDGQVLTWTAVYWRHHSRYENECDSLEDGSLSSEAVLGPDGKVLYLFDRVSIWDLAEKLRTEAAADERGIEGEPR